MSKDIDFRYDSTTRVLHWLMAVGFLYMLTTVVTRVFFKDSAFYDLIWPYHPQVGMTLLLLGVIRVFWMLKRVGRESHEITVIAKMGHYLMYVLMIAIPTLAVLRSYGSGRALSYFGIPLFGEDSLREIEFLSNLGNSFHGVLGWTLFFLIIGHIIATILHHAKGDKILKRIV